MEWVSEWVKGPVRDLHPCTSIHTSPHTHSWHHTLSTHFPHIHPQVGLRAAVAAGMKCIITPTSSTASADFLGEGAVAVVLAMQGEGYRVSAIDVAAGLTSYGNCLFICA